MIVFFPRDLFIFPDQFGRSTDVLIDLFFLTMITLPARDLQSSTRIYNLVHLLSLSLPVQCNIYVYRFSHDVTSVIAVKLMYNSFLST